MVKGGPGGGGEKFSRKPDREYRRKFQKCGELN